MRLQEYIEYSVSPTAKLAIVAALVIAFIVVYFWKPGEKKKKTNSRMDGILSYIEVDPEQLSPAADRLLPDDKKPSAAENTTIEHLDLYVQTLKRHQIRNLDEV